MTAGSGPRQQRPECARAVLRRRAAPVPRRRWDRVAGIALTLAAHVLALAVFLHLRANAAPPRAAAEPLPIQLSLIDTPKVAPPDPPKLDDVPVRLSPPPRPDVHAPVIHMSTPRQDTSDLISESQLAGIANGDEQASGGGGGCNTARMVQQALQRDPLVHTAVAGANRLGKSVMLWNGDWVRTGGQDGKGLSAVREAIMWELAFAPSACRNKEVHGLVLLTLADGNTRFAIGGADWRWSDLLGVGASADR